MTFTINIVEFATNSAGFSFGVYRPSIWERLAYDGEWDEKPPPPEFGVSYHSTIPTFRIPAASDVTLPLPWTSPAGTVVTPAESGQEMAIVGMDWGLDGVPWPRNGRERRIYKALNYRELKLYIDWAEEIYGYRSVAYRKDVWNACFWDLVFDAKPKVPSAPMQRQKDPTRHIPAKTIRRWPQARR